MEDNGGIVGVPERLGTLINYIKEQLQQGVSQEQIKSVLLANGWQENDIKEAFATQQTLLTSLPSATAILKQALLFYKKRLRVLLGINIIPTIIFIGLLAVWGGGLLGIGSLPSKFVIGEIGLLLVLSIVVFLSNLIIQTWGQTALLFAIKDGDEGIGILESYRRGWHKIFSYWWIIFLALFITIGGFLLFIIPGIIFAVWFSLAMFVFIAEDLKGMDALMKSREYVKDNWGKILWRHSFIGIFVIVLSFIPDFIFSLFNLPLATMFGNFTISLFLTPLVMTYTFFVYSNIKAVKGETVALPTKGQKVTFISLAILGILIIPVMFLILSRTFFK